MKLKKLYVVMSDKTYEARFMKAFNSIDKIEYKIDSISNSDLKELDLKSNILTDNINLKWNNKIILSEVREDENIFKYQEIDKIIEQIKECIRKKDEENKDTKIVSFINLNFKLSSNPLVDSIISSMKNRQKIISINTNQILSNMEIAEKSSLRDLYFFEKIGGSLNFKDIVNQSEGVDYLNAYQNLEKIELDYAEVFVKLPKLLKNTDYNYCMIESNFMPNQDTSSILKNSDKVIYIFSTDFDNEYINTVLKYFKENNYSNAQTKILSIGTKPSRIKNAIHLENLIHAPRLEEIIEFING